MLLHLFSTPALEKLFGDNQTLKAMIRVESALAKAQEQLGMIPKGVSEVISKVETLPADKIALEAMDASNLAVPFVKYLGQALPAEFAGYVHYGATSQDILDNALFLQLREAISIIQTDLASLMAYVAKLAEDHQTSVMPARTLLQQAMPTTFGFKCAGFLDALMRHETRLKSLRFTLQNGGAAGTMAGYGDKAFALTHEFAAQLDFDVSLTPYHGYRDRVLEVAHALASLTITLGKFAGDIALMMQTEVGEVNEGAANGRGGSSAMPHKRNPALSTSIIAASAQIAGLMATLYNAGLGEHERAAGAWQSEWAALPSLVKLTGCATARMGLLMGGLEVNVDKMKSNLDITLGLVYSEKVKNALVPVLGRAEAHSLIEKASKEAIATGKHLRVILNNPALENVFDPLAASGQAVGMTNCVLNAYKARQP